MRTEQKELKIERRGDREVVIRRYFNAPRELVFACHTQPDLMRRWLIGPPGCVLDTCQADLRAGGKYLYVYAEESTGKKMGVYGKFIEFVEPQIVSNDENYALDMDQFNPNAPDDPDATVESRRFTMEGDLTLLTHVITFASAEVCKSLIEAGSLDCWQENFANLDTLLPDLRKK